MARFYYRICTGECYEVWNVLLSMLSCFLWQIMCHILSNTWNLPKEAACEGRTGASFSPNHLVGHLGLCFRIGLASSGLTFSGLGLGQGKIQTWHCVMVSASQPFLIFFEISPNSTFSISNIFYFMVELQYTIL